MSHATVIDMPPSSEHKYQEQSTSLMMQRATAEIQSRYAIAVKFPRDIDVARQAMLKECQRPSFCMPDPSKNNSSVAIYRVPRAGTSIEGVTVRFAEMCLRSYKNIGIDVTPLGGDSRELHYLVSCTDYETNNVLTEMVSVPVTIERKFVKDGDQVVGNRQNSKGELLYLIIGTDDDIAMKRNARISKARRNLIMQHIPGWLVEECVQQVRATCRKKDAEDPDAAKRTLYDAFGQVGVSAEQLSQVVGSGQLNPAQLEELRGYYAAIKEGQASWQEIVESRESEDENQEAAECAKEAQMLYAQLKWTPARQRKASAQYVTNPKGLVEMLKAEVAKSAAGQQEPPVETKAGPKPQAETKAPAAETKQADPETKPEPVETKKAEPAAATVNASLTDWE